MQLLKTIALAAALAVAAVGSSTAAMAQAAGKTMTTPSDATLAVSRIT